MSTGEVSAFGEKFGETDLREFRRKVGMVSSYLNDLLLLDDNVLDIVVSGAYAQTRLWGIPQGEFVRKARSLLRHLGCLRYEDSKLRELSQGERQKVMIARALMPDPKLLTFDEPCAGLDLTSRESFLSGIEKIAKSKKALSILYVTHRLDEIPGCFNKALLLKEGSIIASGNIGTVLTGRNISRCFGVRAKVEKSNNRFYAIIG